MEICGERKVNQVLNRKIKSEADKVLQEVEVERPCSPLQKVICQSFGIVNQKNLCIWCMKGDDASKHPKRDNFYKICEGEF